jgi:signal transduction histidine kinase
MGVNLLRTTSFRLAALNAVFFGLSAAALLVLVYWYTLGQMESDLERSVTARLAHLQGVYTDAGPQALAQAVKREAAQAGSRYRYALIDPSGTRVAGSVSNEDLQEQWQEFETEDEDDAGEDLDYPIGGQGVHLPGGWLLWVGRDVAVMHELRERLAGAVTAALAVTVGLALAGGVFMGWQVSRRVEAMNRTARSIMAGDLSRRLAVRGTGDEFDRLADQFNAMLERIQVLMENLRQVSSNIAHDLRTPLAHLRHRLEEMRAGTLTDAGYQEAVDQAIGETDAILTTFEALLRIAQIESGRRRTAFTRVNLSVLLEELAETYGPVAEDMAREFTATIAAGVHVLADRRLLTQMFVNVIENALSHTPAGTRVTLALTPPDEAGPTITVADNGPGVPAEERDKIFRRFYRLDSSRTTPGSGLGLSLVVAIAELHGVTIETRDNQPGLRVDLRFPPLEESFLHGP